MTQEDLKDFLIEEAEYTEHQVEEMDSFDLLNAYLEYQGMLGFTADVLSAVVGAYNLPEGTIPEEDYD